MPVITGALADPVSISGLSGTLTSTITGELAEPVVITGLPGLVVTPDDVPVPTSSPDAVRARVYDEDGVFIAHLPHAQGLRCSDEHNSAGGGSIDYRRYDDLETARPGLWDEGNQILVSVGSLDVFRLVLDAAGGYRIDEAGQRVDTWTGLGAAGVLNSGMVEPEYGWRPEATEERSFDYGSNPLIGGWYVASEWKTPVGKLLRKSWRWTYKKRHLPKGFPDRKAKWIWWRNPDSKSLADETCYLSSSFTLAHASRVRFLVCGDDTLEFQVDGEIRATVGPGGWKKPTKVVLNLSAGTHYIAAKVTNASSSNGNANRSGFLCTIARINGDGDVIAVIRRSDTTHWKIRRQRSGPPGWFPAQIVKRLVDEAKGRACAGHAPITYGFSTTKDSSGSAWVKRWDGSIRVETLGLDWLQQMVETGMDVAMSPNLRLDLWKRRGSDRSGYVRLRGVTAESAPQKPGIRNVMYARAKSGWVGRTAPSSIAAHGRRETGVDLGSSRSTSATAAALAGMINDVAYPPQTIEVELSGATGPQPYKHFNVADWVSFKPSGRTTLVRFRVMRIDLEVTDAGLPKWTVALYED
jgi:hypothetical protein